MKVLIIGGGASGMAAALAAAECPGTEVILLERQARLGKKLSATGNGRCNLTNLHAGIDSYHGEHPDFMVPALETFPVSDTLNWFRNLGLYTVTEASGKVYPYSDQANSVLDVLRFALQRENISLALGMEAEKIRKTPEGFSVTSRDTTIHGDRLIIACGGLAGTRLGGSIFGYRFLRGFGHHCTKLRPTLVQILTAWPGISALKGVRANCHAEVLKDGVLFAGSTGEMQFTDQGFSGPVMYEISRDVCQDKGSWTLQLDFLPELSEEALFSELSRRREKTFSAGDLFTGILHNRLGKVLIKSAGISENQPVSSLTDREIRSAVYGAKHFEAVLTEPLGMEAAQVTAGGIFTEEFDPHTLESRLVPGLYACGEVLDIDGDCGGYNLQWAWSSGRLAGTHAGKDKI